MKPNIPTIKTTHPEMRIELLESAIKTMEQRCIELMKSNESLSVSNAQLSIQNDHLSVKLDQLQRQRSISSQSSMGTSKVRKSSVGSGDERINFNKVSNGNVCSKMLTYSDMSVFNDSQLNNLILVIGRDLELKYEVLYRLKQTENRVQFLKQKEPSLTHCFVCDRSSWLFRKTIQCRKCSRCICTDCVKDGICPLCVECRMLALKQKQWSILCPFKPNTFGHSKFVSSLDSNNGASKIDWTLRAKIELHVTQELKEQVDNLDVCFIVSDTPLEFARKRLVTALEHYDGSSPFVCIDNAISEVEKCATSAPGAMRQRSYPWLNGGYFHLLANAVICFMIEVRPARALARPDALKLPRCLQMSQASKKKLEHRLIRMISEPLNSYGSVPSLRPNLQTQRTFPPRNYFSLQKTPSIDSADGQSYCSEMSAADSDQCSGSATDLSLHMVKHWIEARTGDLVVINCDILCEDPTLKVKWYLGEKQVTSVGRFRITSSVGRHSLEIFDCEAFDSGEVICLAVASSGVCSDVAILNVHEEDIAGEEPSFIEPLTYEQTSNNELILRCVVAGFPMPYVVFHQKNQRIHLDSRTSLKRDNSAWTLTLRDCCKMDEGRYSVIARNRIGRALSHINVESSEDSGRNPSYSFVADV